MNKLLATTAVALVAFAGAASAQSVLERVLSQIDNATNLASVNGTFANIAENIGDVTLTMYADNTGDLITQLDYDAQLVSTKAAEVGTITAVAVGFDYRTVNYATLALAIAAADAFSVAALEDTYNPVQIGTGGINGSINNVIDGIQQATQTATAGAATSVEFNMPTLNFGNMATTALGAVNTGDITLGVNSSVDDAQTSSTKAVSSVMAQLGGSADTGAIVLNIASNMTGINGSINNAMTEVNATIGNLSTTALGAVNTGVIISGVNAAVNGIVGQSGQSGL